MDVNINATNSFPVRNANLQLFPGIFETITTKEDFKNLKTHRALNTKHYPQLMALDHYKSDFHSNPAKYDLHDIHFQDFALKITSTYTSQQLRQLSLSHDHADKRLLRAVVYAVSTRSDVQWDRTPLTTPEDILRKQSEMEDHWLSCRLFDWTLSDKKFELLNSGESSLNNVYTLPVDTQRAVETLYTKYPTNKLAWLNLANAHNTCGTYNVNYGGSQEEEVATNCDGAAILGLHSYLVTFGVREMFTRGEPHVVYLQGRHIPPGGNYFSKVRFITSSPQVECNMIAAAFADFRAYMPVFTPYSEASYYYHPFGFGIRDEHKLEERLYVDIEGVLKTAVHTGMEVLVLGASGCGAFLHDPWREARLWKKALNQYAQYFTEVVFAILPDKRSPDNVTAFVSEFGDKCRKG